MIPVVAFTVEFDATRLQRIAGGRWDDCCAQWVARMADLLVIALNEAAPVGFQGPGGQGRKGRVTPAGMHPLSRRAIKRGPYRLHQSHEVLEYTEAGRATSAIVGTTLKYARYVVEGTSPHRIVARRAKVLAFPAMGSMVGDKYGFAHAIEVHHPGTAPNDYRPKGIAEVLKEAKRVWAESYNTTMRATG